MKHEHVEGAPWWDCAACRRESKMLFSVEGGTPKFHLSTGDLPPYDEVQSQKRDRGMISQEAKDE